MFGKTARIAALLTALMAVLGVAQASASTWTVINGPNFTATAGSASLSTSTGTLSCTGATATGSFSATSSTSVPWVDAASATVSYTGCRLAGQTLILRCTMRFTENSYDPATDTATGTLSVRCTGTVAGVLVCNIVNSAPLAYTQDNTSEVLEVSTTSNLTATNGAAHCPLLPSGATSGSVTLTGTGVGGSHTFVITGANRIRVVLT